MTFLENLVKWITLARWLILNQQDFENKEYYVDNFNYGQDYDDSFFDQKEGQESSGDLRIEVKLKNNILFQAIYNHSGSVAAFCQNKMSMMVRVYGLISFKLSPFKLKASNSTEYKQVCLDVAEKLNLPPEYLFPPELYQKFLGKKTAGAITVDSFASLPSFQEKAILSLEAPTQEHLSELDFSELREKVEEVLKFLPPHYLKVIELRHGLHGNSEHTFEEIGEIMGCTRGNVGNLYNKAICLLHRHGKSLNLEVLLWW